MKCATLWRQIIIAFNLITRESTRRLITSADETLLSKRVIVDTSKTHVGKTIKTYLIINKENKLLFSSNVHCAYF